MDEKLKSQIVGLKKSTRNVANATNAAQREAAGQFLSGRASALEVIRDELAIWLEQADQYINKNMPDINDDPRHEYNVEWCEKLQDYIDVDKALKVAQSALTGVGVAA